MDDSRLVKMRTFIDKPMKESEPTTAREYLHGLRMSENPYNVVNGHTIKLLNSSDEIKSIVALEFPHKQIEVIDHRAGSFEIRVYDMYYDGRKWQLIMANALYNNSKHTVGSGALRPLAEEMSYIKGRLESLKN